MTSPSILILHATMTGNAGEAAELLARELAAAGHAARNLPMREFDPRQLTGESCALLVTSTFGNGDPPDSAYRFWDILRKADGLDLSKLRYSVLALGDSAYPQFCRFGCDLDRRLEALGAGKLADRALCDVDWEEPAAAWRQRVIEALR
ncbi:MAG: flavodoxin domain-containing protein [Candidatus Sumerlaeia bacterium]|nr:flavodoxin domain-containing protein [Candidatus Sumerlaeia bacterium]